MTYIWPKPVAHLDALTHFYKYSYILTVTFFRKLNYNLYCATNRKVAGSSPAVVIGFFIDIKSFLSHYGPGVDSASNKNEYQEHFLGVKADGA